MAIFQQGKCDDMTRGNGAQRTVTTRSRSTRFTRRAINSASPSNTEPHKSDPRKLSALYSAVRFRALLQIQNQHIAFGARNACEKETLVLFLWAQTLIAVIHLSFENLDLTCPTHALLA